MFDKFKQKNYIYKYIFQILSIFSATKTTTKHTSLVEQIILVIWNVYRSDVEQERSILLHLIVNLAITIYSLQLTHTSWTNAPLGEKKSVIQEICGELWMIFIWVVFPLFQSKFHVMPQNYAESFAPWTTTSFQMDLHFFCIDTTIYSPTSVEIGNLVCVIQVYWEKKCIQLCERPIQIKAKCQYWMGHFQDWLVF